MPRFALLALLVSFGAGAQEDPVHQIARAYLDALWRVAPGFQLGFKPGFFLTTSSDLPAGIPIDFKLRVNVDRVYVDGFVGPWFFFKGDVARIHVGMGAGLRFGRLLLGGEVSYLNDGATFGGRIGFQL